MTAQAGDYSFGQLSGTVVGAQLPAAGGDLSGALTAPRWPDAGPCDRGGAAIVRSGADMERRAMGAASAAGWCDEYVRAHAGR